MKLSKAKTHGYGNLVMLVKFMLQGIIQIYFLLMLGWKENSGRHCQFHNANTTIKENSILINWQITIKRWKLVVQHAIKDNIFSKQYCWNISVLLRPYCDQTRLTVRKRIWRLLKICKFVQSVDIGGKKIRLWQDITAALPPSPPSTENIWD